MGRLLDLARSAIPATPSPAEAAHARPRRVATATEAAELLALIRAVLPGSPDEWDECHRIACGDPEAALACWRALAQL